MALKIPLGVSDFRKLRERGLFYVDKTLLIRELLDDSAEAILLIRPRRFGKTMNLSTLRCYLEKSDEPRWPLFEGLAIAAAGPEYRADFQRYPTIALTFKDVKALGWDNCRAAMADVIASVYREHDYLLRDGALEASEASTYRAILAGEATDVQLWTSLLALSKHLERHHREQVLILIDEYDTPIHAAFLGGYYEQAIEFFRNLLSGGLKDNPHLFKGVLTGVLRLAKDSVLTGLNNLDVYSVLRPEYARWFGFTESEVSAMLSEAGCLESLPEVQRWYDGYLFGGHVIYNPWSILSFVKSRDRVLRPYWVETSSNDLVRELLVEHGLGFTEAMEALVRGESIERPIAEHVALREVRGREELVWSLLVFTGYLNVLRMRREDGEALGVLSIPNQEVHHLYGELFQTWIDRGLGGVPRRQELLRALLSGDAPTVERLVGDWALASVSLFDASRPPERFWHGFVLGLLVSLASRYKVLSNRESGHGRSDVMLVPRAPGRPGVVVELKVRTQGETCEEAVKRAFTQIAERDYAATLRARGAHPIVAFAIVFDGKTVLARATQS